MTGKKLRSSICSVAFLVVLVHAVPQFFSNPGAVPLSKTNITFSDTTTLRPAEWMFESVGYREYGMMDATFGYVYSCGQPKKANFNPDACGKLAWDIAKYAQKCSDTYLNPYKSGYQEVCIAHENTGVTVFQGNEAGKDITNNLGALRLWSDACGWLGGRCGDNFRDALVMIIGIDSYDPGQGKIINLERDGFGTVKIYNA